mgnify:CR=1 FL=1
MSGKVKHRAADVLLRELGGKQQLRAAEIESVDAEARTATLAFSSEYAVQRWYGWEILSHAEGACDLSRLNNGGALLCDHEWRDQRGVIESAWIDPSERRGRATVRYSRTAAGEELFTDVQDGIKRHVSVGYVVLEMEKTGERDGEPIYTVTRWRPHEISHVAVPADPTVGVGRSAEIPAMERDTARTETDDAAQSCAGYEAKEESETMNTKTLRNAAGDLVRAMVDESGNITEVLETIERASDAPSQRNAPSNGDAERARVRELTDIANQFGRNLENAQDMLTTALRDGHSPEQFSRSLLTAMNERATRPLSEQLRGCDIGMSERDLGRYSLVRAVRALLEPGDRKAQKEAAFEFEASEAARKNQAHSSDRFVIPTDVLRHAVGGGMFGMRAPMSTGKTSGAATGGYLVATELQPGSFIDILRNSTTIMRRGRVLGGLVGNVDIPKKLRGTQGYWLNGEDTDAEETGIELGQVLLSPKTVAAYTEVTRKMLQQSSLDIEAMLREDLAQSQGLTIDAAGYYGTGANGQPLGIANLSGISAVEFAGKYPTYAELVQMETEVGSDNALVDGFAYAGSATLRGHAKTTVKFAGGDTPMWEPGNSLNGYSAEITNQVADGDVFFANYADLLIGLWGGLELTVDPYTHSRKGRIRITTFQDVDFAHRRAQSFCLGRKAAAQGG